MPQIIPIKDLKNTSEISELCHNSDEPIFVTKNGYGDMVIMSMETYKRDRFMDDIYRKLEEGERDIREGRVVDGFEALRRIREKHGL